MVAQKFSARRSMPGRAAPGPVCPRLILGRAAGSAERLRQRQERKPNQPRLAAPSSLVPFAREVGAVTGSTDARVRMLEQRIAELEKLVVEIGRWSNRHRQA